MRRSWLVRPPKVGGFDDRAIETGLISGEFGVRGDLSDHLSFDMILEEVSRSNPESKFKKVEDQSRQLFRLINEMEAGDLVLHPHASRSCVAIGLLKSGIYCDSDNRPARQVEWLRKDVPKECLHDDLKYSMSAGAQICEISRNNACERFEAIVRDGADPGPSLISSSLHGDIDEATIISTLEARMRLQVGSVFAGHDLAALVGCLLKVDGYTVKISPPGPDGGCDLLAARGGLGIEGPTIAGQVKSGDIKSGDPVLQGLRGVIQARGADKGLLVSWGGVTRTVARELSSLQLQIAYWDDAEICRRLIRDYDLMPAWVRDRIKVRMVPVLEMS